MWHVTVRGGLLVIAALVAAPGGRAQGVAQGPPPPPTAKTIKCKGRTVPQFEDVTEKVGIRFSHTSAPESRYIIESMSGGVLLLDYDRDGWLDIYFTNAPTVDMALKGQFARGALYHNNHDGTSPMSPTRRESANRALRWAARSAITTTMAGRTFM